MANYIETPAEVLNPRWSGRNKKVSTFIEDNSSVLDLGCGAKDLLKYIKPIKYIGIDYYTNDYADIKLDFNDNFNLPGGPWDYIVCSGLLEYLKDADNFLNNIKNKSKTVIITYWHNAKGSIDNPNIIYPIDNFTILFKSHFNVIKIDRWDNHNIYIGFNK